MSSFEKTLNEFQRFADDFRILYEENETKLDEKLRIERKRTEDLIENNRKLIEQLEKATENQMEIDQKYSANVTKFNNVVEELKRAKEENSVKRVRIEELDKIVQILRNDKSRTENELKEVRSENERLKTNALNSEETRKLIEQALAENRALKSLLENRDEEVGQLKEKLNTIEREDPQFVEERLLQAINRLKSDFRLMYERQANFFVEKIDRLKEEQRENICKLYKN